MDQEDQADAQPAPSCDHFAEKQPRPQRHKYVDDVDEAEGDVERQQPQDVQPAHEAGDVQQDSQPGPARPQRADSDDGSGVLR